MKSSLIMEFIDDSPEFCNGFECGMIWAELENGKTIEKQLVHLENSAQIQMICDHFKVACHIENSENGWGFLTTL